MNILITGTSKGIGEGLALHYLGEGHSVYGISRSVNERLNDHDSFHFLAADLADFQGMKDKLPVFLRSVNQMELIVLNAGILSEIKDLKDTSIDEIKKVMDVNVWANKLLIDRCFDHLNRIKQVVAISSGAAVSGSRGWNAYSLSKAALNMLIELYSKEHPETHFCAMAPGIIDTSMQEYISGLPEEVDYPVVKKLKNLKGTPDMPKPAEVAARLADGFENARKYDSGKFLDIRKM
ncbi:MAG: SDR family NAD(P)-dependent oxidoreductase [Bacteroidetes bacterium]|nr:SDR family NAD(P)-dependent oxidoreductase [Bacteroidota bacterium]